MAAETPNIAALPPIAQLAALEDKLAGLRGVSEDDALANGAGEHRRINGVARNKQTVRLQSCQIGGNPESEYPGIVMSAAHSKERSIRLYLSAC